MPAWAMNTLAFLAPMVIIGGIVGGLYWRDQAKLKAGM